MALVHFRRKGGPKKLLEPSPPDAVRLHLRQQIRASAKDAGIGQEFFKDLGRYGTSAKTRLKYGER